MRSARLLALPALLLAAALPAQSPGEVVRARGAPTEPWRTGRFVTRTDSVLVIRVESGRVTDAASRTPAPGEVMTRTVWMPARNDTIALAAVRQLEVRRHEAHRGPRAIAGGAVGAIVGGLLFGGIAYQSGDGSEMQALGALIGAGLGAGAGLLVGAVAGATSARPTRWEPVVLPTAAPR